MPAGLKCSHEGCDRISTARRLCAAHYQAAWKAGELGAHVKAPPRNPNPTICPPEHKHAGSLVCYNLHQCRCEPCKANRHARDERRRKDIAYGRYDTGLVDPEPARNHLLMLSEYGIGYKRVAQLAGIGTTPVRNLIWGRQDPGPRKGEMVKRVKRETAEAILSVQPIVENFGSRQPIPSVGAHRRIHALVTRGWSLSKVARRLDMEIANFWTVLRSDRIGAGLHLRIAALYDELWDSEPAHDQWHDAAAYTRARNYAKKKGWLPPLAWDDIDTDPEPERDVVKQGRATADEILDDVEFLLEGGESPIQVATIVGRKIGTLAKLAERNGRRELANVFGALDRRLAA